jgi:hypothetical protein
MNDYEALFKESKLKELELVTKDIWEEYKYLNCEYGIPFKKCIYGGIKTKKSMKCVLASSLDAYKIYSKVYQKLFEDMLKSSNPLSYQALSQKSNQKFTEAIPNAQKIEKALFNKENRVDNNLNRIKLIQVCTTRNLEGFPFACGITKDKRNEIREIMKKVCEEHLKDDYQCTFYTAEELSTR